jgi:hypothetical protein
VVGVHGSEWSVVVEAEDELDVERIELVEGVGLELVGRVMDEEGREKMLRPLLDA